MWDLQRPDPALVRPGDRVRFKAVRAQAGLTAAQAGQGAVRAQSPQGQFAETQSAEVQSGQSQLPQGKSPADGSGGGVKPATGLVVVRPGLQSTIQDLGRPGFADLGVAGAGAMDQAALRQANRLAGNPEGAAGLEVLQGGLAVTALTDQVLAVAGAPAVLSITVPAVPLDDAATTPRRGQPRHVPMAAPFALLAGETLELGQPASGLRSYLAVRGGFDVEPVMGSRSTDTMSGIGPKPLAIGTHLAVATAPPGSIVGSPESLAEPVASCTELRLIPGPRDDWFSKETVARFCAQEWLVTQQSNRIGLRLAGEPLQRARNGELASEGTVRGAVQVPPEGQPVLFLADHPVTGGYPVIGVVVTEDLDRAAQLPPGHRVRFIPYKSNSSSAPSQQGNPYA